MANGWEITILENGDIRVTSEAWTGPKHMTAEKFLQFIAQETKGEHTRVRRTDAKHHHHEHEHDHEHEHK